jgi:hypothetical protein
MRGEHISFYVVFVAAVYREIITIGVDYTQILKKKDCERKKEKCMFSPSSAAHHRERRSVRNKNETVLKYATMKFFDFS